MTQSYEEAARLYRLAADKGDADAQFSLGWLYEHGEGVPTSMTQASEWYRIAAGQGDVNAQAALVRLGQAQ